MKTYDIEKDGQLFAFEVENSFLGRHGAARVISKITGATIIRKQRRFQITSEEKFIEFAIAGELFVVSEDWNDSSRFWVGPKSLERSPNIERVKSAFVNHKQFWVF